MVRGKSPRIIPKIGPDATDEEYARAMVMCKGYPPSCSAAEECMRDDECFGVLARKKRAGKDIVRDLRAEIMEEIKDELESLKQRVKELEEAIITPHQRRR